MIEVQDIEDANRAADSLAEICESLVARWRDIGQQARVGSVPEARVSLDADDARRSLSLPRQPKNLEYAAGHISGEMVGAISLLLQAIATQLRARPLAPLTIWPLVRAELEYAGRVAWLLQPLEGDNDGSRRVARALLEQLASLQREKYTASKHSKPLGKKLRKDRDALREAIESLFPGDVDTPFESPKQIEEWRIGRESMLSLGKAIDLFIYLNAPKSKAMYDTLSDYSHPSITALAHQSVSEESGGVTFRSYPPDAELLDYQAKVGCLILYKAAHTIAGYYGLDDDPLERWADTVPHWFNLPDSSEK